MLFRFGLTLFIGAAVLLQSRGAAAQTTTPCSLPDVARKARCGAIEVAENPDRPESRKIKVHFAVLPAANGHGRRDPIVPLLGGPGEAAIESAGYFVQRLGPILDERDLLLVDQRGAGESGALRCHFFQPDDPAQNLRNLFPPAAVKRCAEELAGHADLTQYSYARFAADLETVRRTLGYGRLNLNAGSYGTRAAQVFVRLYPESVRTLYLGSVVPVDIATPLVFAKSGEAAMERTVAACANDSACRSAFPMCVRSFGR